MSVSQASNPNWRADAGLPPEPRCGCGHPKGGHRLVGNKGCHATLNQPTEYHPGPCERCDCRNYREVAHA